MLTAKILFWQLLLVDVLTAEYEDELTSEDWSDIPELTSEDWSDIPELTSEDWLDIPDLDFVFVKEEHDVILPCSLSTKENIAAAVFDWKKDGQKEVFSYNSGLTYNNGLHGQDEQFRGRVSYFEDELKNGNASIKILNTTAADSGNYVCNFPHFQPRKTFTIDLTVGRNLKDRSHIPGASSKPHITTLLSQRDKVLLQCEVQDAFPKPEVEWRDGTGVVFADAEPQVLNIKGRYYVYLNLTVTRTDTYYCVVTQEEIGHQVDAEMFVPIRGPDVVKVVVKEGKDVILPCSLSTKEDIEENAFNWRKEGSREEVFDYSLGFIGQDEQFRGRVSHFEDELKNSNASIKILNTTTADSGTYTCIFPLFQPRKTFHIELIVEPILKDRSNIPEDSGSKVDSGWLVAAVVIIVILIIVVVILCIKIRKHKCSNANNTARQANGVSLL